jgi:hypothetical protein
MKFNTLLTLTFCFIIAAKAFSQNPATDNISIKGTTFDIENNQPLAYVSVGVLNKPQGTLSDSTGNFSFQINKESLPDTLQISFVGYSTKKIAVKDFIESNNHAIGLNIKFTELDEVVVPNEKKNSKMIGRQSSGKLIQVSIHHKTSADETIGSEMGMRYKIDIKKAILKDFNFYISTNNFNSIKFRVNIYSVKNNMPDTLLYNKQIFATLDQFKTGWTKLDLEQYGIKVHHDFIITLQWVESKMEKKENPVTIVPVAITPFSKNCYVRIASQDKWKRMGMSMSNFVTLAY